MSGTTLVFIAFGLALDAFAVALAASVSLRTVSGRQVFRLAFHFGLFQAIMPVLGWLSGYGVSRLILGWDHWIAFGLLAFVGCRAIYAAARDAPATPTRADPTRGLRLLVLSVATSLDAFAVGLSFAMLQVDIWYPAAVIGVVTAGLTVAGMLIGSRLGARFGRAMEFAGGAVLIAVGIKIVVQHLANA